MSRARQHHFLSEFYLEGFTKSGTTNDRIYVLDLTNGRSWNQIPREIATCRDFDSADIPGFDPDETERALARVEDILAPVIRRIRETHSLPTDDLELDYVLNFVATSTVRVPKFRRIMAQPLVEFANKYMRDIVASQDAFKAFEDTLKRAGRTSSATFEQMKEFVESGKYTVDAEPATHLQNFFLGTETVLKWLSRFAWSLVIAEEAAPDFIFSDCPVVLIVNPNHWRDWRLPAEKMPTDVVMPISRRLLLWGLASRRCVLPPLKADTSLVASFNTFVLAQADRYVFSSDGTITWGEGEGKPGNAESLIALLGAGEDHDQPCEHG